MCKSQGQKPGNTGNGIAVYSFVEGKVAPARFIALEPQALSSGKKVAAVLQKTAPGTAIPYPAGLALIPGSSGDKNHDHLLIANNFSDNAVLLEVGTGKILQRFDLSTSDQIPSSFPYTCVATRDGRRGWCSLWNASRVADLNLTTGQVARWIKLKQPDDPIAPGSHPTAMLLSPDEKLLYVALSNADAVAAVSTESGQPIAFLNTTVRNQDYAGTYPSALAQSADGKRLFAADASADAVAVFDTSSLAANGSGEATMLAALGFIPTDWYPSALAVQGDDLLIATAKGQGTKPNNGPGKTAWEIRHHDHPYIPTLLRGSIARLNIPATLARVEEFTRTVEQDNLLHSNPGAIQFPGGKNPIKHVIYVIKENRTYDQVLGDLGIGNGDPSLTLYGADITPNEHKLARQFGVMNLVVLHKLADLQAAGDAGSRAARIAEGLVADASTRIVYHQDESQVPLTRSLLGLSESEARLISMLSAGQALWRVSSRSFVVQHYRSRLEAKLTNTDTGMHVTGSEMVRG